MIRARTFRKAFLILIPFQLIPAAGLAEGMDVTLQWSANTEPDLAGYRLYYGTASRVYDKFEDVGNVTEYTLQGLLLGPTYFFALTAYDTEQLESDYSDEVSCSPCTYSISPSSAFLTAQGGQGTVQVTTGPGCSWATSNSAPWVTIIDGQSGVGSGSVSYSLSANTDNVIRVAGLTIAGMPFTVTQRGTPAVFYITALAGAGGIISPAGNVVVSKGGSQTFTITSNAGYWIAYVRVDGVPIGATASYTFNNVNSNHTIGVAFGKIR